MYSQNHRPNGHLGRAKAIGLLLAGLSCKANVQSIHADLWVRRCQLAIRQVGTINPQAESDVVFNKLGLGCSYEVAVREKEQITLLHDSVRVSPQHERLGLLEVAHQDIAALVRRKFNLDQVTEGGNAMRTEAIV